MTNWPVTTDGPCPECNEPLATFFEATAIDAAEASRRIAWAKWREFEAAETEEQAAERRRRFDEEQIARFSESLDQL